MQLYQLPPFDPSAETPLRFQFVEFVLQTLLYGAYFVVFAVSAYLLVLRQQSQGGQKILLAFSAISFFLATLSYANRTYVASTTYVDSLFKPPHNESCAAPGILTMFGLTFNVVCGDALLLHRTFIVWNRKLLPLLLPSLFFSASIGVALFLNVLCAPDVIEWAFNRVNADVMTESWVLLSVAFNLIATGLIGWRLLGRRSARVAIRANGLAGRVGAVAILLAESALLYAIVGVLYAALYLANSLAVGVFRALYQSLAFLNPAIIILRVALNPSNQEGSSARFRSQQPSISHTTRGSRTVVSWSGLLSKDTRQLEGDVELQEG